MDCEPSESSCERRHHRRCLEPAPWRILVGSPAMAVSVGTVKHAEMVPGYDENALHRLGKAADASRRSLAVFRLFHPRLARTFLDRRDPHGLLPAPAVLREQPSAPETWNAGRR